MYQPLTNPSDLNTSEQFPSNIVSAVEELYSEVTRLKNLLVLGHTTDASNELLSQLRLVHRQSQDLFGVLRKDRKTLFALRGNSGEVKEADL